VDLADLWVPIKAKLEESGFNKAQGEIDKLRKSADATGKVFEKLGGYIKGAVAAYLGIGGIKKGFATIMESAERGEGFEKLATTLGMTADEVQRLNYVAEQSDTSIGSIESAFKSLAAIQSQVDKGSAKAQKTLDQWGVNFKDPSGKWRPMIEVMKEVADEANALSPEERLGRLQALFGGAGTDLIKMFKEGSEGMTKMMGKARVMTEAQIKASAQLKDIEKDRENAFKHLSDLFAGQGLTAATRFNEALAKFADDPKIQAAVMKLGAAFGWTIDKTAAGIEHFTSLVGHAPEEMPLWEQGLRWLEKWGISIIALNILAPHLATALSWLLVPVISLAKWFGNLVLVTEFAAGATGVFTAAFAGFAATVGVVVASLVGLVLVLEDVYQYLTGGESVLGHFMDWVNEPLSKDSWLYTFHELLGGTLEGIKKVLGMNSNLRRTNLNNLAETRKTVGGAAQEVVWNSLIPGAGLLNTDSKVVSGFFKDLFSGGAGQVMPEPNPNGWLQGLFGLGAPPTGTQTQIPGASKTTTISAPVTVNVTANGDTDANGLATKIASAVSKAQSGWMDMFQGHLNDANGPLSTYGYEAA